MKVVMKMRRYRLKVGLDVDDTLYVCNEYALTLLKNKYGDIPELDVNGIKSWGKQGNVSDERLKMFEDPEFVSSQPICAGAQRFVRELCKIADVFFVTAVPPSCMSARAERLRKDFPEVPAGNLIFGTRKDIIRLDILLDDAAHNISNSQASYPVLMRKPWNIHLSGLLSVNTYDDFLHLVKTIRNSFIEKVPDLSKGGVVCLVGPSGTGKTQIASELIKDGRYKKPLTTTTRKRKDDEDENAYIFVSEEEFIRKRDAGEFIETTVYSKYYFGTSDSQISPIVENGGIAVIPIDICGALTIKNIYKSRALLVFTERSKEAILLDIINRSTDDEDKIRRIMSIDFENRNAELCDIAVNFDRSAESCANYIKMHVEGKG